MKERINWTGDKKRYQPRIRSVRIKDLHSMKEFTGRPMTVLLDEALSIYLSTFIASPEYTAFCEEIEKGVDARLDEEPNTDDFEDLSSWL